MQAIVGYLGATIVAIVFFLLVFFAALTSLVSIIEIPISYWIDEFKMTRRKAVLTQAVLLTLFAIPATLSFGMSEFFTSFTSYGGLSKSFFDVVYDVFYETILPLVGFTVCLFTAYRWKMSGLTSELIIGDDNYEGSLLQRYLNFALGTIIPLVLFSVFVSTVIQIYL
jgi:NSS family neurotransmitter:Na+ symporter